MIKHPLLTTIMVLSLTMAGFPLVPSATGDQRQKLNDSGKEPKKNKKLKAPKEPGTPTLWKDRGEISRLDLFLGIGSEKGMPKPPLKFNKEDVSGSNPKIKVTDAKGVKWNIKFDEEVHSEVAASRLAWACGYMVEENYFIPTGQVTGVTALKRARKFLKPDGSFVNGLFEKRPDDIARRGLNWTWESNPFIGTKELSGLAIINCLLNNWDAKKENNNVLGIYDPDGQIQDWYLITDWGSTFGKIGGFTSRTKNKWNLDDYAKQGLVEEVKSQTIKLRYAGKMDGSLRTVPRDHVRWFCGIIGNLTDRQIRDAFKAAGANQAEMDGFTRHLRKRIDELKSAAGK